jgi:hypothetical protein
MRDDSAYYKQDKVIQTEMQAEQIDVNGVAPGQIIKIQREGDQIPFSEIIMSGAGYINNIKNKKESQKESAVEQQAMLRVENEHVPVFVY